MKLKEIEGARLEPGETLVVIPPRPLSGYQVTTLGDAARKAGIRLLVLPTGSKVYVQAVSQAVSQAAIDGTYSMSGETP